MKFNQVPIPTEGDWRSTGWWMDTPYAYRHFFGKTIEEGEVLFQEASTLYQEDLVYMPLKCFLYYVHSYINYLFSDESKGDSDGASCFFSLFENRKEEFTTNKELMERSKKLMRYLGDRQDWYEAPVNVYGLFAEKANEAIGFIEQSESF